MALFRARVALALLVTVLHAQAFVVPRAGQRVVLRPWAAKVVDVSLPKPLGIALEELQPGKPAGVRVQEVREGGSAIKSGDVLPGMVLVSLNGIDCTTKDFDTIMDMLIGATDSQPIQLSFSLEVDDEQIPQPIKTGPCELHVLLPKGETMVLKARNGDNLRKVLMAGKVSIYEGLAVMTNCNGAGQCGTCVTKVVGQGWSPRSDYEANKLKGRPQSHRLACQTLVEGDAVITVRPAKNDS
ncbi:hypothetical protein JKP88DRAFT_192205 [Tribonema minus]|uniref:2Fe-2S ferredoxin-type domain-containing protein n=1 Tax=Tribonema minus TaxID=303371 RepID=A0A836CP36_9STRA|nr:hypothetical protein JKP88DRAFT_192205 [Tribonema minus]